EFGFLFNSYYEAVGPRWPRDRRGLLARPTVEEVYQYRSSVDEQMVSLLETLDRNRASDLAAVITLGIHHEQQHQELIVTDLKHPWAANPLRPVYCEATPLQGPQPAGGWVAFEEGLTSIGHGGGDGDGFAFDNESPRHRVFLNGFELAVRPVTNGQYLAF